MENIKYIPGDLVMTDGVPTGTKKCVVYVVTASDPSKILTLKDGTINKGVVTLDAITEEDKADFVETTTWVKHIVPIPLTPQILMDNGWGKVHQEPVNCCNKYKKFRNVDLTYNIQTKTFFFEIFNIAGAVVVRLPYVHTLQHLLFGLGLDSSLKV